VSRDGANTTPTGECIRGGGHEWVADDNGSYCEKCIEPKKMNVEPPHEWFVVEWMKEYIDAKDYDKAEEFTEFLEGIAAETRKQIKRRREAGGGKGARP
jgi:hypothetical protein